MDEFQIVAKTQRDKSSAKAARPRALVADVLELAAKGDPAGAVVKVLPLAVDRWDAARR